MMIGNVQFFSACPDDCAKASMYAQQLGIYAVPFRFRGRHWWRPRLSSGHDPDLGWLLQSQPSREGWPTWEDAVNALGEHLSGAGDPGVASDAR